MNIIIYLVVAAIIGWVATEIMHDRSSLLINAAIIGWVATEIMHDRSSLLINIIVAIVGAFLAGFFISPLIGVGTINDAITIPTMLVTLLGAIILIALVRLIRRGR